MKQFCILAAIVAVAALGLAQITESAPAPEPAFPNEFISVILPSGQVVITDSIMGDTVVTWFNRHIRDLFVADVFVDADTWEITWHTDSGADCTVDSDRGTFFFDHQWVDATLNRMAAHVSATPSCFPVP